MFVGKSSLLSLSPRGTACDHDALKHAASLGLKARVVALSTTNMSLLWS
jgi:hypothetical protein